MQWLAIGSWQQPAESNHWSWSFYNYTRSCWRIQRWSFNMVIWHLKRIGKVKKLEKWVPYELTENKKIVILEGLFLFYATTKYFLTECNVRRKVYFMWQLATTSSVVGLRRSSKALHKAKLAPKKEKKVMVTIWWSVTGLIHYSFLNHS